MADPEKIIIDAITALGIFAKVRYLIAEADSENEPTELPIFVLSDDGRDYSAAQTFCGNTLAISNYSAIIIAESASECRSLFNQSLIGLIGIATVTGAADSYDEDISAFMTTISLIYT